MTEISGAKAICQLDQIAKRHKKLTSVTRLRVLVVIGLHEDGVANNEVSRVLGFGDRHTRDHTSGLVKVGLVGVKDGEPSRGKGGVAPKRLVVTKEGLGTLETIAAELGWKEGWQAINKVWCVLENMDYWGGDPERWHRIKVLYGLRQLKYGVPGLGGAEDTGGVFFKIARYSGVSEAIVRRNMNRLKYGGLVEEYKARMVTAGGMSIITKYRLWDEGEKALERFEAEFQEEMKKEEEP